MDVARLAGLIAFGSLLACRPASMPRKSALPRLPVGSGAAHNLEAGCVADPRPNAEYFPDRVSIQHATQFTVRYGPNWKLVEFRPNVYRPERQRFLLVQCGTQAPAGIAADRVIPVPARRFILNNPALAGTVTRLGLLDYLVGVASMQPISQPAIIARFEAGHVLEVGSGPHASVEAAVEIDPDLLFTFYSAYPEYNVRPKLWEAGINAIPLADHFEPDPLARAEWMKFLAVFFNREREANALFEEAAKNYSATKRLGEAVANRPEVLLGSSSARDTWLLNGGRNFMARLVYDAGGKYFWHDELSLSLVPAGFERVFSEQAGTSVWLSRPFLAQTRRQLTASDPRLAFFAPVDHGRVLVPDRNPTVHHRAPWSDQSLDHPDFVLADLMAALHPELLPHHEFHYLRRLD
jgi:iron complex transport system substrate-binding protein